MEVLAHGFMPQEFRHAVTMDGRWLLVGWSQQRVRADDTAPGHPGRDRGTKTLGGTERIKASERGIGSLNGPALHVSVVGADGTPVAARVVGSAGAWIGRAAECEIAVADPERHLSARHCRIDFADDSFWITDQSTNGTFLNGSTIPLPKGERQPLAAGDRLRVGRFVVTTAPASGQPPMMDVAAVANATDPANSPLIDPPWELQPAPSAASAERTLQQFGVAPTPPVPQPAPGAADTLSALLTDLLAETPPQTPPAPPPSGPQIASRIAPRTGPGMSPVDRLPEFTPSNAPVFGDPPPPPSSEVPLDPLAPEFAPPLPTPPMPAAEPPGPAAAPQQMMPDPLPGPSPASLTAMDDLVSALASEISQPAAGPHALSPAGSGGALEVYPPERSGTASTRALAAFWCGLGVMPSGQDPASLAKVMMELGAALRVAVDGFTDLLGPGHQEGPGTGHPFADGHAGLRRAIENHGSASPRIDDLMRAVFTLAAEREDAYVGAVRTALRHALRSMAPTALESRFGPVLQSRRQSARRAELMDLMFKMEAELLELAEAQFRKELNGLMRQRIRRRVTFENGGSHD